MSDLHPHALGVAREVLTSRLLDTRSAAETKLAQAEAQYIAAATSLRETRATYETKIRELERRVRFHQATIDAQAGAIDRQRRAMTKASRRGRTSADVIAGPTSSCIAVGHGTS